MHACDLGNWQNEKVRRNTYISVSSGCSYAGILLCDAVLVFLLFTTFHISHIINHMVVYGLVSCTHHGCVRTSVMHTPWLCTD